MPPLTSESKAGHVGLACSHHHVSKVAEFAKQPLSAVVRRGHGRIIESFCLMSLIGTSEDIVF
jgi:hypothetical protein